MFVYQENIFTVIIDNFLHLTAKAIVQPSSPNIQHLPFKVLAPYIKLCSQKYQKTVSRATLDELCDMTGVIIHKCDWMMCSANELPVRKIYNFTLSTANRLSCRVIKFTRAWFWQISACFIIISGEFVKFL